MVVFGAALHPAEREEELAVVRDGQHMLIRPERHRHRQSERRLGRDDRRIVHVGQFQDAQPGIVAAAGGERQRPGRRSGRRRAVGAA